MPSTPTKTDSSDTLRTTKTMREKAKLVSRCIINLLKFWRVCCREKKTQKDTIIRACPVRKTFLSILCT